MSDHETSIKPGYDFATLTSTYTAECSCGWAAHPSLSPKLAHKAGRLHLNSVYGKEKHASPATADWHLTLKSPNGNTYTLIVDGLAEAIDYAHTMRFDFGWELLDFHREQ